MGVRRESGELVPKCCLPIGWSVQVCMLIVVWLAIGSTEAQVISPELRRLSVATNQFGIDALKALDRFEPPDKVLVFCPACISSSLMMIMMGSSKYPVVSSLRHALYVWSMKPQEINRGFKDIFEHIGFNQNSLTSPAFNRSPPVGSTSSSQAVAAATTTTEYRAMNAHANLTQIQDGRQAAHWDDISPHPAESRPHHRPRRSPPDSLSLVNIGKYQAASLPALIKFKQLVESRSLRTPFERPWWHGVGQRWASGGASQAIDQLTSQSANNNDIALKEHRMSQNESTESSQMSAMSNIYIQRGLTMNYNYNLLLRQYYKTVIHPVDFLRNSEETRLHINSLVASSTENKIKDLIKKSTFELRLAPKIMMISTFHFRGTLDIEMKARNKPNSSAGQSRRGRGQDDRFASNSSSSNKPASPQFIETESAPLKYGHFASLGCSVIEVPFDNRLVTLVIVMPDEKNSTDVLLTRLSAQILSDLVNSLVVKRLSLSIPVIKFDRGPVNMNGLLRELGLDSLFYGDKAYSTETGLNRWLRPSDIVHETSIDIGTINPDWSQPEDRLKLGAHDSRSVEGNHIKLNKPFFYFVIDSINSLILTMGRIR